MTPKQITFLQSDEASQLLSSFGLTAQNHLQMASQLRQQYQPDEVHALLETVRLRQKATRKFSRAADMLFVVEGLEQASGEEISQYRAQRFAEAGLRCVADLCCGLGGDAIGLTAVSEVIALDLVLSRLILARHNVGVYGRRQQLQAVQADLLTMSPLSVDGLFFDPARRDEQGKRIFSVNNYRPPLSLLDRWRSITPSAAVKISPGVDYRELPADAEAEFISVGGEVKECVLWYGRLRSAAVRRATILPQQLSLTTDDLPKQPLPITTPQSYLYEPDGAVIRAHLVQALGAKLDASQIDADIAYLTAETWQVTPFATSFEVLDWFPFQLKRLRQYLRAEQIGRVELKKRGSPLDMDQLRHKLRLKGDVEATLFFTQVQGRHMVVITRRMND